MSHNRQITPPASLLLPPTPPASPPRPAPPPASPPPLTPSASPQPPHPPPSSPRRSPPPQATPRILFRSASCPEISFGVPEKEAVSSSSSSEEDEAFYESSASPPCPNKKDTTDCSLTTVLINTVKAVVVHLMEIVITRYRREICNGCVTDHPSQRQHPCLEVAPDYFYSIHYQQLNKRLWTEKLVPAISKALVSRSLHVSNHRIQGVVESFLDELKSSRRIESKVKLMFDRLVGKGGVKLEVIQEATDVWLETDK